MVLVHQQAVTALGDANQESIAWQVRQSVRPVLQEDLVMVVRHPPFVVACALLVCVSVATIVSHQFLYQDANQDLVPRPALVPQHMNAVTT